MKWLHGYYYRTKDKAVPSKWNLWREMGRKSLSLKAQLKLEWIIFYCTISEEKASITANHFGITPKTFYKWLSRFDEKHLESLEEKSRAPIRIRKRDISFLQRARIRDLRKKHLRWGKMKLKKRYFAIYKEHISSWKIQKVIEEEQLYFDKTKQQKWTKRKKQAQIHPKKRITQFIKEDKVNHLWHVDTVLLTLVEGGYRYLLTAIDEISKLAYARLYTTHSSKKAADFLKRLHYLTEGEMINLHHDNGSEFEKDFKKACAQLSLPQWYSRARTPTDNPVLERFNRTIQEEFVEMIDIGVEDVNLFNQRLLDWLIEYNSIRPHETLDYLTPLEYIEKRNLLPMSSSCTYY